MNVDLRYPDPNERPTYEFLDVNVDPEQFQFRTMTAEEIAWTILPAHLARFHLSALTVYVHYKYQIPNRFHRFMQRLILGIRWEIHDD